MVAPIRFAAPRAAPGMSECAAIVTRREDREMGKQGGALVNEALSAQTIRHTVEEPTARPVSKPLTSSAPDCFGSCTCQRCKQSAHGVGHVFVRTDQRE